jgi:4'-phosphopantetheinyl transferase EntD
LGALNARPADLVKDDDSGGRALRALHRWLCCSLPAGFASGVAPIVDRPASAFASEEVFLARAVAQRRDEFRAGRVAARLALSRLGCAPAAIPAHAQRDPVWPRGFIGSIAHANRIALAIAAHSRGFQGAGIDLEDATPLEPRLVGTVCRQDERAQASAVARLGIDHAKLCFVAKEALLKAILPRRRQPLRFDQLRVAFDTSRHLFRAWLHEPAGKNRARSVAGAPVAGAPVAGAGIFHGTPNLLAAVFVIPEWAESPRAAATV